MIIMIKNCALCKDEFRATRKTQKYCKKPHYKRCPVCREDFLLKRNRETKTCSVKCSSKNTNKIYKEYILTCKLCGDTFSSKYRNSNICKKEHHRKCIVCSDSFKIKDIYRPASTCSSSCASSLTHTPEAKENRKINSLAKHGTEYTFQAESVVRKIKKSLDSSDKDFRIGSTNWNRMIKDKYNVENISQVDRVKEMKRETYYNKYGVFNPAGIHIENYVDWDNFDIFVKDKNWDLLKIANYFNTGVGTVREKAFKTNTQMYIEEFYTYSESELEVKHILNRLGLIDHVDFIPNDRRVISPLELDFYIPELKLAIEVSPTYTHNSKVGWGGKGQGLNIDYHHNKLKMCNDEGVELITMFDWSSLDKLEQTLKSILKEEHSLNKFKYITNPSWEDISEQLNNDKFKSKIYKKFIIKDKEKSKVAGIFILKEDRFKDKGFIKSAIVNKNYNIKSIFKLFINGYMNSTEIKSLEMDLDLSIDLKSIYEEIGFFVSKDKVYGPRVNYHDINSNIHIKSDRKISKYKIAIEDNGWLPVYDCGYTKAIMILQR